MAFQDVRELLGNRPINKLGEIGGPETWWVERRQLKPLSVLITCFVPADTTQIGHRHGLAPTCKLPLNFEDGYRQLVNIDTPLPTLRVRSTHDVSFQRRLCMGATRISDDNPLC